MYAKSMRLSARSKQNGARDQIARPRRAQTCEQWECARKTGRFFLLSFPFFFFLLSKDPLGKDEYGSAYRPRSNKWVWSAQDKLRHGNLATWLPHRNATRLHYPFGGTNDHPSTPTFLQIYKILSVFSILKPPKLGNCTLRKKIWLNQIKWLVWRTSFDLKKWFVLMK